MPNLLQQTNSRRKEEMLARGDPTVLQKMPTRARSLPLSINPREGAASHRLFRKNLGQKDPGQTTPRPVRMSAKRTAAAISGTEEGAKHNRVPVAAEVSKHNRVAAVANAAKVSKHSRVVAVANTAKVSKHSRVVAVANVTEHSKVAVAVASAAKVKKHSRVAAKEAKQIEGDNKLAVAKRAAEIAERAKEVAATRAEENKKARAKGRSPMIKGNAETACFLASTTATRISLEVARFS